MSGLSSALNSALKSLDANQFAIAVASNNISNAQTPGYSRHRAVILPSAGGGVDIAGTESIRDKFIDARLRQETAAHSEDQMKHQGLSDIEVLFNESETGGGMLPLLSNFFNSFHALSTDPASISARQQVLTDASQLTNFLNSRANSLNDIQFKTDQAMRNDVADVNTLVDQIATISRSISGTEVTQPAHELRDQRTVLVQRLAEIVNVREVESGGEYQLTAGTNRPLIYNGSVTHLQTGVDASGMTTVLFGIDDITSEISGGRLGARFDLRDNNIPAYIDGLDQIAFELASNVNSIHSAAYGLDGNTGNNFFAPLTSAAGAARTIAVDAAVTADPRKVAASQNVNGTGNEAALALGNLLHDPVFSGGSIVDQYRSLIYRVGNDTSTADLSVRQHEALLHQLENRRQEVSGVSIDEEAVQILQFQRSFEASARVVKTIDELLQLTLTLGQ